MSEQRTQLETVLAASHPVLSCEESAAWEERLLDTDKAAWQAMQSVGRSLAEGIVQEYGQTRFPVESLRAFAIVGKGHNGGDAMLALTRLAEKGLLESVAIVAVCSLQNMKANAKRAFDSLEATMPEDALTLLALRSGGTDAWLERLDEMLLNRQFDLCVDGLLGMSFKPPLRGLAADAIKRINQTTFRLRVAVDLPSGLGDASDDLCFRADATFATGIFKKPLLNRERLDSIGCIRYLDVGFFENASSATTRVLVDSILDPLRKRRKPSSDKRSHGRLLIIAGSRNMPGALAMSVLSALQSGAGLVTVCAPESLVSQLAATIPEAMWIPWPETPEGGLSLEGVYLLKRMGFEPDALLIGPGMGTEAETSAMLVEAASSLNCPVVVDADALRKEVIDSVKGRVIATPHLGEYARLVGQETPASHLDDSLVAYAKSIGGSVVLKGANARISDGDTLFVNPAGNAVLARGGSGDLLAGMTAALLAASPDKPIEAACRAVYWHGKAADLLAIRKGHVGVRATDLLDMYPDALM